MELELICISRALLISCTFACVRLHLHARHNAIFTHIAISPFAIRILLSHRIAAPLYLIILLTGTNEQADWASLSLVPVLFSWCVGSYDFDFWGDLAYICIVFINTSRREETQRHGHGEVPVTAALRLLASRPLLPSAAACPGSHAAAARNFGLVQGERAGQQPASWEHTDIGQAPASTGPGRTHPRPARAALPAVATGRRRTISYCRPCMTSHPGQTGSGK